MPKPMFDATKIRLGKKPARHDPRMLLLEHYISRATFPTAPPAKSWTSPLKNLGPMGNLSVGDCTCAAAGHHVQTWTASAAKEVIIPDAQILAAYSAITGYVPGDPSTDNGANELDVLNYWRQNGIGDHAIGAYVAIEPGNHEHVRDAVAIFGGCYIGIALPVSAQNQTLWTVPPGGVTGPGAPGSWGGHAVPVVAYDDRFLTVITWGKLMQMTWQFWDAYCDEAYALVSRDFLSTTSNKAPNGFDWATLNADIAALGNPGKRPPTA